jgi:hypothetical protein
VEYGRPQPTGQKPDWDTTIPSFIGNMGNALGPVFAHAPQATALIHELNRLAEIEAEYQFNREKFIASMKLLDETMKDEAKDTDKKIDRGFDMVELALKAGDAQLAQFFFDSIMKNTSLIDKLIAFHREVTLSGATLKIVEDPNRNQPQQQEEI